MDSTGVCGSQVMEGFLMSNVTGSVRTPLSPPLSIYIPLISIRWRKKLTGVPFLLGGGLIGIAGRERGTRTVRVVLPRATCLPLLHQRSFCHSKDARFGLEQLRLTRGHAVSFTVQPPKDLRHQSQTLSLASPIPYST